MATITREVTVEEAASALAKAMGITLAALGRIVAGDESWEPKSEHVIDSLIGLGSIEESEVTIDEIDADTED